MPHRRSVSKGSFGGHFDELVKHFPHGPRQPKSSEVKQRDNGNADERSVHDRLFECAWKKAREEERRPGR